MPSEDKVAIRNLLRIIEISMLVMNYQTIVTGLSLVSGDLYDIATQTDQQISRQQAEECHLHLNSILRQLMLAIRIGKPWSQPSTQAIASTTCQSSTRTSTACRSTQTSELRDGTSTVRRGAMYLVTSGLHVSDGT